MKRLIIILLCSIITSAGFAQESFTNLYYMSSYLANPAFAGSNTFTQLCFGYKNQLSGIDGAPTTYYITANIPLGGSTINDKNIDEYITSDEYLEHSRHHGLGIALTNNKIGPFSKTHLNAGYAYHLPVNNRYNLSFGIGLGVLQERYNQDLNVYPDGQTEPLNINSDQLNKVSPDLNFGLLFYGTYFFSGLSIQGLLQNKSLPASLPQRTVTCYTGYKWMLDEDFALISSAMLSSDMKETFNWDLNIKTSYKDLLWAGGSYRTSERHSFMCGIKVSHLLNVNYAYELSSLKSNYNNNPGAHQFTLNILLNNKKGAINTLW